MADETTQQEPVILSEGSESHPEPQPKNPDAPGLDDAADTISTEGTPSDVSSRPESALSADEAESGAPIDGFIVDGVQRPAFEAAAETTPEPAKPPKPFMLEHPPTPPPAPEKPSRADARNKANDEASQSPFSITVGHVYDGPMDLLLDLIRKQNIDIYDIPIAKITAQFLEYTHHLKQTDVDAAGEFIYVASLLIHIKSKTLLPRDPLEVAAGNDEDPRLELVTRLLEHERFKAAAQMLQQKQMIEDATWTHSGLKGFLKDEGIDSVDAEREIDADTVDLVRVFQDILTRLRERPIHSIDEDSVTVAQMIQFVKQRLLMEDRPISLRKLLSNTKSERALICTFLAMLELVRLQAILLRQQQQLADILIKKTDHFEQIFADQAAIRDDWS